MAKAIERCQGRSIRSLWNDMTDTRITTIERAFQLAREGACRSIGDIRDQLTAEGCDDVFGHLSGLSIQRQLSATLAARGVTALDDEDN